MNILDMVRDQTKVPENIFPIGTQYTDRQGRKWTVRDYMITLNREGDVVKFRYSASCDYSSLALTSWQHDVVHTTIARRLAESSHA